jgi:hypothetical protein
MLFVTMGDRLVDVLADGAEQFSSVRTTLEGLEVEAKRLEADIDAEQRRAAARDGKVVDVVVDEMLEGLAQLRAVFQAGEPEERKAAVRAFIEGIQIDKAARRAILRWYRLPRVESLKMVELRGFEPLTPRLPALCSPN